MNRRIVISTLVLAGTVLIASACSGVGGGAPSIKDARSCLTNAKMDVQGPQGADAGKVSDGVSATAGLTSGSAVDPSKPLTIVVAANVKADKDVASFVQQSKSFSSKLSPAQKKTFAVHSGHSGKYVWVVAGDKSSGIFQAAEKCVKAYAQ